MNDEELSKLTSVELLKHGESLIEEHGRTIRMHSEIMNADELKVGDIVYFKAQRSGVYRATSQGDLSCARKAVAKDWHNTKIKVDTPEKSKLVQELLFSYGITGDGYRAKKYEPQYKYVNVYSNNTYLQFDDSNKLNHKEVFFSDLFPDYKEQGLYLKGEKLGEVVSVNGKKIINLKDSEPEEQNTEWNLAEQKKLEEGTTNATSEGWKSELWQKRDDIVKCRDLILVETHKAYCSTGKEYNYLINELYKKVMTIINKRFGELK